MALIEELAAIVGADQVLTGTDAAPFGTDWTGALVTQPLAVVRPADTTQVAAVVRACRAAGTAMVPVSGNTGLAGGTMAEGAVMISLSRLRRIVEIRPEARVAVVEAGVVLSDLHDAVAEHGLAFPLTFGARGSAMIGGVLSTNAGGSNVLRYGSTRGMCLGLEAVLPDGAVLDLMGQLHKDNSGYALKDLLIGAEGTLGLITGAVLRLVPAPKAYATALLALPSLGAALEVLNRLQEATGGGVEAFEYMPAAYHVAYETLYPTASFPLAQRPEISVLVEVGATASQDAAPGEDGVPPVLAQVQDRLAQMMEQGLITDAAVARSEAQRRALWARREAAAEVTVAQGPMVLVDIAVPLDAVEGFLARVEPRVRAILPDAQTLWVSHLGDGNIHYSVHHAAMTPPLKERLTEVIEDTVAALGGSFSAEHGVGTLKRGTMARRKDPVALATMQAIKRALDPENLMNPGKVLP